MQAAKLVRVMIESVRRRLRFFCEVARSTAEDVEPGARCCPAAKIPWGETSLTEQGAVLNAIADAIEANLEMLAMAEMWENGKPVREPLAADLPLAVDHFRYFAGTTRSLEGRSTEIDKALASSPRVAKISFTGETTTGR